MQTADATAPLGLGQDVDRACLIPATIVSPASTATSIPTPIIPSITAVPPDVSDEVRPATQRVLLAFVALTLLATISLFVLAARTEHFFAWTIMAEPTAAFLGAAYAAGFVLSVLALGQQGWGGVRVALLTVAAFTVLTLIPTLNHLHIFHLLTGGPVARFAAWFWLAIYVVIPVACLVAIRQQVLVRPAPAAVSRPIPHLLTAVLAAQGLVLLVTGAVLYVSGATVHHHSATSALSFWPWAVGPLAAQAVGAWLIALGLAAALVIRERDLDRLFVPAATYLAFGAFQLVVLARYFEQARTAGPWLWIYGVVLVSITITGAYGSWRARAH